MAGRRRVWLVAGALVVAAGSIAALVGLQRSFIVGEWLGGLDVDPATPPVSTVASPTSGRKEDRLPQADPATVVARQDQEDFRRLGRPSIDAIWAARMALPRPGDWARESGPPPALDPTAPLAYAAARATEPAERDPFRVIEEGAGRPVAPTATVPLPLPRPQIAAEDEEEEEEEEEEAIPVPVPRPRGAPQIAAVQPQAAPERPQTRQPAAPPATAAPAPSGAAPPPPRAPVPIDDNASPAAPMFESSPSAPAAGNVRLAALTPPSAREPVDRAPPAVMTPFGVPFVLQTTSVQTNCFPPALVDLLRRLERHYGKKPVITSGYRVRGRSGSLHRRCMAADIMVPGVSGSELARTARTIPGMGGVGQYCHPTMIHVDIGTPRDWRYGCGSFFALRDGSSSWSRAPGRAAAQRN